MATFTRETTSTAPLSPAPPAAARRGDQPAGTAPWIRRHPIGAFCAFFFTIGWLPAFLTNRVETGLPPQSFILATTWLGLLAVLLITWLAEGPAGLRALRRRALAVAAPAGWYAFALLSTVAAALPIAVALNGPPQVAPWAFLPAVLDGLLLQTAIGLFTNNLAEEVTWMGLVQARLQARHGPMLGVLLTAPLFLLQHLTLQSGTAGEIALWLVLGTALMVPFRALLGWVYNRTQSLFLVALLHAASNAAAGGAGFGPGLLPRLYPGQGTETVHVLGTAVLGLAVIALTRARLGARARRKEGEGATVGLGRTPSAA